MSKAGYPQIRFRGSEYPRPDDSVGDVVESQLRVIVAERGVFLRREANAIGYDDRAVQRAYRSGAWIRVHHGCYTFPDIWSAADEVQRHRIRARAVLRTHNDAVVLSHASSVLERDVDVWGVDLTRVHITKAAGQSGGLTASVHHHVGGLPADDVEELNGVRATRPARAVIETMSINPLEAGVVLADSALHKRLVSFDDLRQALRDMDDWPGSRTANMALRLADARAESVGESRARFLMWSQAIPCPELQYEVIEAGRVLGICDFAWPKQGVLGEFDGRIKYGRLLKPGESVTDAVLREKEREQRIHELTGWRFIRLSWSDLHRPAETAQRIRRILRHAD